MVQSGKLIICLNNCSTQYKSRFTVAMMKSIAEKYNFTCCFGEPGHGRGLFDAMSSFGCKTVLRQAIINDEWSNDAGEMV